MEKTFTQLGQTERDRIELMLESGAKQYQIAKVLEVDKSTISREIKHGKLKGKYNASYAQHKADIRRRRSKYQGMKVECNTALKEYIIKELQEKRSPDEIAGRIRRDKNIPFDVGKDAIYKWLYSSWGQQYCPYICTKRYKVKKQKKNSTKRVMIPDRVSIHERPLGATNKTRYKHFETDTIVAPKKVKSTEAVAISTEIKSKFIIAKKIASMSYPQMTAAMRSFEDKVHMLSSTADNGIENKGHKDWGMPTFFADPHSPWQKPLVEGSIGLLRRWYFKKGTDWSTITEEELQEAISTLNNKYRKSLNYASALEVATAHGIFKSDPN